jgi:hypothetical protein
VQCASKGILTVFKAVGDNIVLAMLCVVFPVHNPTWLLEFAQLEEASSGFDLDLVGTVQSISHLGLKTLETNILISTKLLDLSEDRLSTFTLMLLDLFAV